MTKDEIMKNLATNVETELTELEKFIVSAIHDIIAEEGDFISKMSQIGGSIQTINRLVWDARYDIGKEE